MQQTQKPSNSGALALLILVLFVGGYWWHPIYQSSSIIGPYLEDPEAEGEEWDDYTWGDTETEAQQKCQRFADDNGVSLIDVSQVGRKRWRCKFRARM